MNTTKMRNATGRYFYPGSRVTLQRGNGHYGPLDRAAFKSWFSRSASPDLVVWLRARLHLIGLVIVLIAPLLLIVDSLQVFALLMSDYAVGLVLGIIKFKLCGPRANL